MTLTPIILDQLHKTFVVLCCGMALLTIIAAPLLLSSTLEDEINPKWNFISLGLFVLTIMFAILQAFFPALPGVSQ